MALDTTHLIGAWDLADWYMLRDGERGDSPMGANPTGRIMYSEDGRMAAFLQAENWREKRDDGQDALAWFTAYSGKWSIHGDEVHHDVDFSSTDFLGDQVLVRTVLKLKDYVLRLETPEVTNKKGQPVVQRLNWVKVALPEVKPPRTKKEIFKLALETSLIFFFGFLGLLFIDYTMSDKSLTASYRANIFFLAVGPALFCGILFAGKIERYLFNRKQRRRQRARDEHLD